MCAKEVELAPHLFCQKTRLSWRRSRRGGCWLRPYVPNKYKNKQVILWDPWQFGGQAQVGEDILHLQDTKRMSLCWTDSVISNQAPVVRRLHVKMPVMSLWLRLAQKCCEVSVTSCGTLWLQHLPFTAAVKYLQTVEVWNIIFIKQSRASVLYSNVLTHYTRCCSLILMHYFSCSVVTLFWC